MGSVPFKFLIDGIDRLGKSTLIQRIQAELGYHLVIHYDKPQVLQHNLDIADDVKLGNPEDMDPEFAAIQHLSRENIARRLYQDDANRGMFNLMLNDTPIIFDRTHLGELVYAPLYRGYNGDYVYQMEKEMLDAKPYSHQDDIRLILLTSSNLEMLEDDGLSFDFSKKGDEQQLFVDAFNKSNIVNKVIVDVHNGQGGYKSYEEVYMEAIYKAYK